MEKTQIAGNNRDLIESRIELVDAVALETHKYRTRTQALRELRKRNAIRWLRVARVASQEALGLFLGLDHASARSRFFKDLENERLVKRSWNGPASSRTLVYLTKKGFREERGDYSTEVSYRPKSCIGTSSLAHDLVTQALVMAQIEYEVGAQKKKDSRVGVSAEVAFSPILSGLQPKKPDGICQILKYDTADIESDIFIEKTIAFEYEASPKNRDYAERTLINCADLLRPPLEHLPWEFDDGEDDPDYQTMLDEQEGSGGIDEIRLICRQKNLQDKYARIMSNGKAMAKVEKGLDGNWLYDTRALPRGLITRRTGGAVMGRYKAFIQALEATMPR